MLFHLCIIFTFSALTLLLGQQEGHLAGKKNFDWWGTGMVICLERDADLHMAQLMPLPLTVSWFSKIQIGFTQWCIAKNGGGYTQRGMAKGLKVPCLFMIAEVSIHCQETPRGWYTPYTHVYPPIHHCPLLHVGIYMLEFTREQKC